MKTSNHYKDTENIFNLIAVTRKGFYDAKSKNKLKHTCYQLMIRKKILKIFQTLQTSKNLEIGCGNGDFLIKLAKKYPELFFSGIDFSGEQLNVAKENSKNIKNINFEMSDALKLKFKDESFDTIFCINTFHHIKSEDHSKALAEFSRVSKENIILEIKNRTNFYYKYLRTGLGKHKAYFSNFDCNDSCIKKIHVYPTIIPAVKKDLEKNGFELISLKSLYIFPFLSPLIVLHFRRIA